MGFFGQIGIDFQHFSKSFIDPKHMLGVKLVSL